MWKVFLVTSILGLSYVSADKSTCVYRHNSTVASSSRKFDCKMKDCWTDIAPSSNKATELEISSSASHGIQVLAYYIEGKNKVKVPKGISKGNDIYFVGPGEGFYIRRLSGSCKSSKLPGYKFTRVAPDRASCDPMVVHVGSKVEHVQRHKQTMISDNCPYHLTHRDTENTVNETLYLLSVNNVTMTATLNGEKGNQKNGSMIVVKNWTTVDFIVEHEHLHAHHSTVTPILAVSTKRSCSCNMVTKLTDTSVIVQSPGYPDFLCPGVSCTAKVSFPPATLSGTESERRLVKINAKALAGVSLHLKSETVDMIFDDLSFIELQTKFVIDGSDLEITYTSSETLNVGEEGHFKLEIEQFVLRAECDCSLFTEKQYSADYEKVFRFPSDCDFLFCDWTIISVPGMMKTIDIGLINGLDGDEITIWNGQFTEKYDDDDLLMRPRTVNIIDSYEATHMFFSRTSRGPNATLYVAFDNSEAPDCSTVSHFVVPTEPIALTSSHYPLPYFAGNCGTLLEAPENYHVNIHITDMDVEHFHDELIIYDGQTAEARVIEHLSGIHNDLMYSSSGKFMFLDFTADEHNSRKGYHMAVVSMPDAEPTDASSGVAIDTTIITDSATEPSDMETSSTSDDVSDSDTNHSNSTLRKMRFSVPTVDGFHRIFHSFIISAVVIASITIVGVGIFIIKKQFSKPTTMTSFDNVNVTFRSEEHESIVRIENETEQSD